MEYGFYRFFCRWTGPAELPPFKGSTFRGGFGHQLKASVCALRQYADCRACPLRSRCMYARVFELDEEADAGSRVSAPPHPLLFVPPEEEKTLYAPGDRLVCGLKAFGAANEALIYFVHAFQRMGVLGLGKKISGHRGTFVLERVDMAEGPAHVVYAEGDESVTKPPFLPRLLWQDGKSTEKSPSSVRLVLETPLRLKVDGKLPADLPFDLFVRQMLRRMSAIFNAFGEGEPNLDYPAMIRKASEIRIREKNLRWFDWQRYSNRQEQKMFMGGLVGDLVYEGDLEPFLPLFPLAEALHVGKNTMFGLGRVRWEGMGAQPPSSGGF